jgi:hypothetical protein
MNVNASNASTPVRHDNATQANAALAAPADGVAGPRTSNPEQHALQSPDSWVRYFAAIKHTGIGP